MELGLNIAGGCALAISEMYGDWYRDPWGWPEYRWLSGKPDELAVKELVRKDDGSFTLSHPAAFHILEVPKNRLAVRPAVVQDSLSRLMYATAVASNMAVLHRDLPDWVYGWRSRGALRPASNRLEWPEYIDFIPTDVGDMAGLQVDISSFFASIDADRMSDLVYQRLGKTAAAGIASSIIRQHDSLSTRSGIPQRSYSSAALAHLYLQPVDDALQIANRSGVQLVTRWMDDITALGAEDKLYRLYLDVQDRLRQLGLEPNAAKTRLSTARQAVEDVRFEGTKEIRVPRHVNWAASGAPTVVDDLSALERLEEILVSDPSAFSRTWLRATLASLRQYGMFDSVPKWVAVAHKMPHAADGLSRFLRASAERADPDEQEENWDELSGWFVDFCGQEWARLDWVTSQLALTFPTGRISGPLSSILKGWLSDSFDIQKVAIATQRLASATPVDCRDIIRSRIDKVSDPTLLRIFGIGLLAAGDSRRAVRSILDRDRRNMLVLRMLEDRNWKCPEVEHDFDIVDPDDLA